jgi:chromate transporter
VVAGLAFIIPAVAITLGISYLYMEYGNLPQVQAYIYGIKPAIIAVIVSAVYPLTKTAVKSWMLALLGAISFILSFAGYPQIWIMLGAGIAYLLVTKTKFSIGNLKQYLMIPLAILVKSTGAISSVKLFFIFLKIGAILYGSGYVLFAFLDTELVTTGYLTREVLADAIAIGQMTPGPVFSSVTFIGYYLAGWEGAFFSTLGVFLPSFLFIALLSQVFMKLKSSPLFMAFLSGVNVAAIAMIASVAILLGMDAVNDWRSILIGLVSLAVAFGFKRVNSAFVVVGGALLGYLLTLV